MAANNLLLTPSETEFLLHVLGIPQQLKFLLHVLGIPQQLKRVILGNKFAIMTSLLTKEEQEELLNQKIEMMKRKNAELIRRHQLVEEDKRLAEQQGRSVTIRNLQDSYSPMKGEILRAAEEENKGKAPRNSKNRSARKYNDPDMKLATEKTENKDIGPPPPDPSCKFLADRRREGPLPDHGKREYSRRHPRNFGGVDFNDVPKKIHDEKERQTYQPQIRTKADETLYTTGKERRELEEWRREREKIDRERLERQKNKEGNWRREWDRDKDELSYTDEPIEQVRPLDSRPTQLAPRTDDRFKPNGRGRYQRKKDSQNGSNAATVRQVNDEATHRSNSDTPQHFTSEIVRHSREKRSERSSLTEKSSPQAIDHKQGDEEKRFREVQEQNDSLFIKIKAQPSDFSRVPSNKAVNLVEFGSLENAPENHPKTPQNHPKNDHRNFRDRCAINKFSSSFSDSFRHSEGTDVPDVRRGEGKAKQVVRTRIFSKSNGNVNTPSSSRKADKEWKGEKPVVEPRSCSEESSQGFQKKLQSDSKAERFVGSGRISVHGKKRKNKNQKKRGNAVDQEQCSQDADAASSSATVMTQKSNVKLLRNEKCEAETEKSHVQCKDVTNEDLTRSAVCHNDDKNRHDKEPKGKKKSCELAVEKGLDKDLGKSDLLDTSFDLDQDPPEGDQFDDEEWEDIDEEVCIDLIAGGEESYDDDPLNISDDTLDQFVSAHRMIIEPEGHKVVDWAAEMESVERDPASEKQGSSAGPASNLPQQQSP